MAMESRHSDPVSAADHANPFLDENKSVGRYASQFFSIPVGPSNPNAGNAGVDLDTRPDCVPIAPGPFEMERDPMVARTPATKF